MIQSRPRWQARSAPATTIHDLRTVCKAMILSHQQSVDALQERASTFLRFSHADQASQKNTEKPAASAAEATSTVAVACARDDSARAHGGEVSSLPTPPAASLSSANTEQQQQQDRDHCAQRVLKHLACIRHELSRIEEALHYREQYPCEALSDTEAWLLKLRRGPSRAVPPPSHITGESAPSSPPLACGAAPALPAPAHPSASTGNATPQGPSRQTTAAAAAVALSRHSTPTPTTASASLTAPPHKDGTPPRVHPGSGERHAITGSHPRRHTRRPSSVNLPEFASVTSTLTELSTDGAPHHLALRHGPGRHSKPASEKDENEEHLDSEGLLQPLGGWATRAAAEAQDDSSHTASVPEARSITHQCIPSVDETNAATAAAVAAAVAAHNSTTGAPLKVPLPLPPQPSAAVHEKTRPNGAVRDDGGSSCVEAVASLGGWVPRPLSLGNMDEFVLSLGGSPSEMDVERLTVATPQASQEDAGDGRRGTGHPAYHARDGPSQTGALHDAPPRLSQDGGRAGPHHDNHNAHSGGGGDGDGSWERDQDGKMPCAAGAPQLSMFERRRIRRLLGVVATDIVSVSLLMDELGSMMINPPPPSIAVPSTHQPAPVTQTAARKTKKRKTRAKEGTPAPATQSSPPPPPASPPSSQPFAVILRPKSTSAAAPVSAARSSESGSRKGTSSSAETLSRHSSVSPPLSRMSFPVLTSSIPPKPSSTDSQRAASPLSGSTTPANTTEMRRTSNTHPTTQSSQLHVSTSEARCGSPAPTTSSTDCGGGGPGMTASILYRSPLTASRSLPVPGPEASRPSAAASPSQMLTPTPAPTTAGTTPAGESAGHTGSDAHNVPSAVSFMEHGLLATPDSSGRPRAAPAPASAAAAGSGGGEPRNSGAPEQAAPLYRSPSTALDERPSSGHDAGSSAVLSRRDDAAASSQSALPSRRSLCGPVMVEEPVPAIASSHGPASAAAAALSTPHCHTGSHSGMLSPTAKLTSPTGSVVPPLMRSGSGVAGSGVGVPFGGSSDSSTNGGGTNSRPMSRTASMMRRPRKLDVTTSNTKELAPLVHHYRVTSQGGASTHSVASAHGVGPANAAISIQPSASSFRSTGGGRVLSHMIHTPSCESLQDYSEVVNLNSPLAGVDHRRTTSFSASYLSSPAVGLRDAAEMSDPLFSVLSGDVVPVHRVASERVRPIATRITTQGGPGTKAALDTPISPAAAVETPKGPGLGGSSCESNQGLRGTNSSFYTTRALTPTLPSQDQQHRGNHQHQRVYSVELPHLGQRMQDGGSFRSGCASPLSASQPGGGGGGTSSGESVFAHRVMSASSRLADIGGSGAELTGYALPAGHPRSGSMSSTERSAQSGWTGSFGEAGVSFPEARLRLQPAARGANALEESHEPSSPPPAMATVGPHTDKANAFVASFLAGGGGAGSSPRAEESFNGCGGQHSPSSEAVSATHTTAVPASTLLTTLRPGETHSGLATSQSPLQSPSRPGSPRTTYAVNVSQLMEFVRCLHTLQGLSFTEEEFNTMGLVYGVPGVCELPSRAAGGEMGRLQTPNKLARPDVSETGSAQVEGEWLLPLAPGSATEKVRMEDFNAYVTKVDRKVREVEVATGLTLFPR